jgi:hypothetical protein
MAVDANDPICCIIGIIIVVVLAVIITPPLGVPLLIGLILLFLIWGGRKKY